MLDDIIVNWHTGSKAAVIAVAHAKQLPADILKYAAQTSTPLNTIAVFRHLNNSNEL